MSDERGLSLIQGNAVLKTLSHSDSLWKMTTNVSSTYRRYISGVMLCFLSFLFSLFLFIKSHKYVCDNEDEGRSHGSAFSSRGTFANSYVAISNKPRNILKFGR